MTFCEDCADELKEIIGYEEIESDYKLFMPYNDEILERMAYNRTTSYLSDCIKRYRDSIQEDLSEEAIRENLAPTF